MQYLNMLSSRIAMRQTFENLSSNKNSSLTRDFRKHEHLPWSFPDAPCTLFQLKTKPHFCSKDKFRRIIKVENDLQAHLVQPASYYQYHPVNHVQPLLEHPQGWWL